MSQCRRLLTVITFSRKLYKAKRVYATIVRTIYENERADPTLPATNRADRTGWEGGWGGGGGDVVGLLLSRSFVRNK